MGAISALAVAPNMRDRKLKTFVAQEFQTTIVGMLGHDLRQSLQIIQGTYGLLRSRLEEMPGGNEAHGTAQLPGGCILSG